MYGNIIVEFLIGSTAEGRAVEMGFKLSYCVYI